MAGLAGPDGRRLGRRGRRRRRRPRRPSSASASAAVGGVLGRLGLVRPGRLLVVGRLGAGGRGGGLGLAACASSVVGPPAIATSVPPTAVPSGPVTVACTAAASSGATTPSAASAERSSSRVMPAWRRRQLLDLVPDVLDRLEPRSAPSRRASSAAIIQSARAVPGGVTFWPSTLTRPSRLVVVPPTSAKPAAGSTTSASAAESVRKGRRR